MKKVCVIIPNYNGMKFMPACMAALERQSFKDFEVLVVDNGSSDGSREWLEESGINTIFLEENLGFAGGVNAGLRRTDSEYVILLNNDTEVFPDFVGQLVKSIARSERIFSVSPMMIQSGNHELIDDAGDGICILGWPYQIGVGEKLSGYNKKRAVFSACAGASIYRKQVLDRIGFFDELHFAYLEDIDLGYRARLAGYYNIYEPKAKVYHFGSGTSGSKYNPFKVRLAARNHIFLHYKNQPALQLLVNFMPLLAGMAIKAAFFYKKGFLKDYADGIKEGLRELHKCRRTAKAPFYRYLAVEWEMLAGTAEYVLHFVKRRTG